MVYQPSSFEVLVRDRRREPGGIDMSGEASGETSGRAGPVKRKLWGCGARRARAREACSARECVAARREQGRCDVGAVAEALAVGLY